MRAVVHPGKHRLADHSFLGLKLGTETVRINATEYFEIVLQDSPERVLNSEARYVLSPDLRPQQFIGGLDRIGLVLFHFRNQACLSDNPERLVVERLARSPRIKADFLMKVDVVRQNEDLFDLARLPSYVLKQSLDHATHDEQYVAIQARHGIV